MSILSVEDIYRKYSNLYGNNQDLDPVLNPNDSIPSNYFNNYEGLNLEANTPTTKSKLEFLKEEMEKQIEKEEKKYIKGNEDDTDETNISGIDFNDDIETDIETDDLVTSNTETDTPATSYPKTKEGTKRMIYDAYRRNGVNHEMALMLLSQDQLESGLRKPQGTFNYGNITVGSYRGGVWKDGDSFVNGRDHDANGNRITNHFRNYRSIDEYVQDKLAFLRDLYGITTNETIDSFLDKLTGNNKGKRKYAENPNYFNRVKEVYEGNKNYA